MTTTPATPATQGSTGSTGDTGDATQRAVPYHCPFCAEEDLRPVPSGAVQGLTRGGWHCRSCLRVFSIGFHGLHRPDDLQHPTGSDGR